MKMLADFQPLKLAEQELFDCCQSGEIAVIGEERPTEKTEENEIRADFLRWLILTKEIEINSYGIWVKGAYISGNFNLENCKCEIVLSFMNSNFKEKLLCRRASIESLILSGSLLQEGLNGDGLICKDLFLNDRFIAASEVRLISAKIDSILNCSNGSFKSNDKTQYALNCSGIQVNEGVFFCNDFIAEGEVFLVSAKIGKTLDCSNGSFKSSGQSRFALNCSGIQVDGYVFLRNGFNAEGEVWFASAKIGNSFECYNGTFKVEKENQFALACDGMQVSGALFLQDNCTFKKGILSLANINVSALADDKSFWEQTTLKKVILDGFKYGHIYTDDITASFRLQNMLAKMTGFEPQPYKQLAKVLRDMGHDRDADEVMIALHDKRLELSKESKWYKAFRKIYKWTSAYGYRPMRTLKIMASVWFLFGCIYWYGANVAVFAPSNPLIFQKEYNCAIDKNGTKWLACPKDYNESNNWYIASPAEYTTFQPFWYSLDIILPVVDLKMENDWGIVIPSPEGNWSDMIPFTTTNHFIRFLTWVETLAGWGLSLMLVAILSGLAKNEKE